MPGATVASDVSCAWEIAAKLDMMPQTVPNRPTNGATEEMTARLGSPPSERVRSSRAARAIASEMRALSSLTVSPGMRRRASSSPAAATPASDLGMSPPARAARTARRRRTTEIRALDDQHPAPDRGEKQDPHDDLADEARVEKKADRREIQTLLHVNASFRPVARPFGVLLWRSQVAPDAHFGERKPAT